MTERPGGRAWRKSRHQYLAFIEQARLRSCLQGKERTRREKCGGIRRAHRRSAAGVDPRNAGLFNSAIVAGLCRVRIDRHALGGVPGTSTVVRPWRALLAFVEVLVPDQALDDRAAIVGVGEKASSKDYEYADSGVSVSTRARYRARSWVNDGNSRLRFCLQNCGCGTY